jgi:hypothetical protein
MDGRVRTKPKKKHEIVNLYLVASTANKTKTHIDVCEDMRLRMVEHDPDLKMPGAPKTKKTGKAPWHLCLILIAYREDQRVRSLMEDWKVSARGLESRICHGIGLAMKHGLLWLVSDPIGDRPSIKKKIQDTIRRGTKRLTADNSAPPGGDDFIIGGDEELERGVAFIPKARRVQVIE